jgi:tetrahydromethanopterin S-methyltransferase subunit A
MWEGGMEDQKEPHGKKTPLSALMHALARMMPANASGENPRAVEMYRRMAALRELANPRRHWARLRGQATWPVSPGRYAIGSPTGAVAVCVLTSSDLVEAAGGLEGVAISGRVYTPNLGIEKIILNLISNPNIRFLLLCGKESPVFFVGQALQKLFENGVDSEKRVLGADGPFPVLTNLTHGQIQRAREQVQLVDHLGLLDLAEIGRVTRELALRSPGRYVSGGAGSPLVLGEQVNDATADSQFKPLRTGGHRQPLVYDPNGFIIISVDAERDEIVVRHYRQDHTPAHILRGRSAEPLLLGLLREGLVTQLSHAGYLGVELTKAELALKLGQPYEQDKSVGKSQK